MAQVARDDAVARVARLLAERAWLALPEPCAGHALARFHAARDGTLVCMRDAVRLTRDALTDIMDDGGEQRDAGVVWAVLRVDAPLVHWRDEFDVAAVSFDADAAADADADAAENTASWTVDGAALRGGRLGTMLDEMAQAYSIANARGAPSRDAAVWSAGRLALTCRALRHAALEAALRRRAPPLPQPLFELWQRDLDDDEPAAFLGLCSSLAVARRWQRRHDPVALRASRCEYREVRVANGRPARPRAPG